MAQKWIVEGNDAIALSNLLMKRGLPPPEGYDNLVKFRDEFVLSAGGYNKALVAFAEALDNSAMSNIGIIVDANDAGPSARWDALKKILLQKGFPDKILNNHSPQLTGICIKEPGFPVVGIWIMPNNASNGYLEHFIAKMIPETDSLLPHADSTLNSLEKENLVQYAPPKRQKALIHTWLSWQQNPGLPFGQAIQQNFLDSSAAAVDEFVEWFKNTFVLGEL